MNPARRPAALIFDVDGTLAETEELHREAFNASFKAAGLPWVWDRALYADLLEVTGGKERLRSFIDRDGATPDLDAGSIARIHADKTARYTAAVASGSVALRPGIRRLLAEAQAAGTRLAIATTTSPANVDALLRATLGPGGPALFDVVAAGDSVPAKKPAPDIYRLALDGLGVPAAECIAFEDTLNGLRSARGAGIPTVMTVSVYGGSAGFGEALAVVDHLGDPGLPCRSLQGAGVDGPMVGLEQLSAWISPSV